jgi:uncharacterized membrane protein HdeD (DUF308 family)
MTRSELRSAARGLWWLLLARGILTIIFGLFALFAPGTALLALVIVFAVYAVLDGVMAITLGLRHRRAEAHWGWHIAQGVISVLAGIVAFAWPGVTVLAILFVIAFWSIVNGVAATAESFTMRKRGSRDWGWTLARGILSVLLGIVLIAQPGPGLLTLLWLVGTFCLILGIIIVLWAVRLRAVARALITDTTSGPPPHAP